jgi:ArsR family transcriptional regulator, arsenate/arsenite/antimonite-responsive transcriptional repressor
MSRMIPDDTTVGEAITVLKALADPNRFRIFAELMQGDSCNCELKDNLGLPPNLLSHHLRTLSEAGLVTSRRDNLDGRWIYYSVDREAAERWQAWFSEFLDPVRIQERIVCGPEGQILRVDVDLMLDRAD